MSFATRRLVSPDGQWISWIAPRENFLSKCLGGRAESITAFPGAKITVPQGAEGVPGLSQGVGRS